MLELFLLVYFAFTPSLLQSKTLTLPNATPPCLDSTVPIGPWQEVLFGPNAKLFQNCSLKSFSSNLLMETAGSVYTKMKICLFDKTVRAKIKSLFSCQSHQQRSATVTVFLKHPVFDKSFYGAVPLQKKSKRSLKSDIKFEHPKFHVKIPEESDINTPILTVRAFNPDRLPLFYSMMSHDDTRSRNFFHLNRSTGELRTISRLDREDMDKHVLRVTATESGNPTRTASTIVYVDVEDTNDNVPAFERRIFVGSISESAEVGTTILHVHAHDRDADLNGKVKYSFDGANSEITRLFSINPDSGVIQVKSRLDREVKEFYRMTVRATDQSLTNPLSSTAIVEVTLNDANDNAPQFDHGKYYAEIPENLNPKQKPLVARIVATDRDDGDNGKVRYSIVSGNLKDTFSLDYESGEVHLKGSLNFKSTPVYELVIRAQDSGLTPHSNTTLLEIVVTDVNDNAPKFYTNQFEKSIREDVPVGSQVTAIKAYDPDSAKNAELRYSLKVPGHSQSDFPFEINSRNGEILTTKKLDREACDTCSVFRFYVVATDSGDPPLSAEVPVVITILDVNDNRPAFDKKFYNVTVREDAPVGQQILRVRASDLDESAKIEYSLNTAGNEEETFLLLNVEDSGLITLNSQLDYKTRNFYTLTLKAADSGGKFDTSSVYIHVSDVNSPPTFTTQEFTAKVRENSALGTVVTMVDAGDNDEGLNAKISYKLIDGGGHFKIDKDNGVISVNKNIDREEKARYDLTIVASDSGKPPLSASTRLEILIMDTNDNAPVFSQLNYTVSIPEDLPVETSFFQVTATDADEGASSRIVYSFGPDTAENDTFLIDATSGTIRTALPLDREQKDHYELHILASDKGLPPKIGTATVFVKIGDRNDNPPRFSQDIYHLHIAENQPIGSVVARIVAKDPDVGPNAKISYRIYGGPDMGAFELSLPPDSEPGVDIITRIHLDYESKRHYQFQLQASSGDLSSVTEIRVNVQDTNDNRPVLKDFFVIFHNYPDYFPLHAMGRIPAYDPDENDTLLYSFVSGNEAELLIVDPQTGFLRLSPFLNTNRQISAEMKACVSDGVNLVCAQCSLRVVLVTQKMLLNSVTLKAEGVSKDGLLSPVPYSRLVDALSTLVPSLRQDVIVFSVQENLTVSSSIEGEAEPQINISFSIRKAYSDSFISSEELRELVHLNRKALSDVANLDILPFDDNLCVREPCYKFEQCQNVLKFGAAPDFTVTDNFLFRPVDPVSTFMCVCPEGFAGKNSQYECDTEVNLCYSSPCGSNGTCIQKENGYSCLCPPSRTGSKCEYPLVTEFCLPGICRGGSICDSTGGRIQCKHCPYSAEFSSEFCELRARNFDGNGFVTLAPLKQRYRFQLEISVATVKLNAALLYNGRYLADNDFILLNLRDGYPEFSFSLGGNQFRRVSMPQIHENFLSDGKWHKIKISYLDKTVTMSTNNCETELALRFSRGIGYPECAVRAELPVQDRCSDPAVICYRFLDLAGPLYIGGLPDSLQTSDFGSHQDSRISSSVTEGLDGCIRDLKVDGETLDLGKIVSNRGSKPGCSRLQDSCAPHRPCSKPKECRSVWGGYKCTCDSNVVGQNCTKDSVTLSLTSEESYVSWKVPDEYSLPLTVGVTFRTRQKTATPLAVVFQSSKSNKLYLFVKIRDSRAVVEASGKKKLRIPYPSVSDGQWHTAVFVLAKHWIQLTVDYIYEEKLPLRDNDYFYKGLEQIYTGSVGGLVSAPFIGCVKGVFVVGTALNNPEYLPLENRGIYNTKTDCSPSNACVSAPCPINSHCLQDWDSYKCTCLSGFIGSKCMNICELKGLCRNGGTCVKYGEGYFCKCSPGYAGSHCESPVSSSGLDCPSGWWGRPLCGPCKCTTSRGYSSDCDKLTGQCKCKALHYKPKWSDSCFPCDCNFPDGARNSSCHPETGECECRGDVKGRRCDSCPDHFSEINRTTGFCRRVDDGCPASFSHGINWNRTNFSGTAREQCPVGSTGMASRYCSSDGVWKEPELFNCTSHSFAHLASTLSQLDEGLLLNGYLSRNVAEELQNATGTARRFHRPFFGQDVYVGYRLILALLRYEMSRDETSLIHIQDKHFVQDLIKSCSDLLKTENSEWWAKMGGSQSKAAGHLLDTLDSYGKLLAKVHLHKYLRPFQATAENMVFAVDSVDNSKGPSIILPKYDNFLQEMNVFDIPISVEIPKHQHPTDNSAVPSVVFYSVYSSLDKIMSTDSGVGIGSPILSLAVYSNTGDLMETFNEPLKISFPINKTTNLTGPECVWWNAGMFSWSPIGCEMFSRNESHITCSCHHSTSFAVAMDNSFWQFTLVDDMYLSYVAPTCAILCLALLCLTFILLCGARVSEGASNRRVIHQGIIFAFALNIGTFLFVVRSRFDELLCSAIGSILHFAAISLFSWLFLSVVHLYRTVTDLSDVDQGSFCPYFSFGIVLPAAFSGVTAVLGHDTINHSNFCWFNLFDPYVWSLIAPVSLLILLSLYVNAMCAMIAFSKEWDVMFSKLNFRNTLFRYFLVQIGTLLVWVLQLLSINFQLLWLHYAYNGCIVLHSATLLIWLIFFDRKAPGDLKTAVSLWLTEEGTTVKPQNGDVLLPINQAPDNCSRCGSCSHPESPVLAEEMAPRPDEDSSAFHAHFSDTEIDCDSNAAQVNNRMMTLPLRNAVARRPYATTYTNLEDESSRPFLSEGISGSSGSLKRNTKPDLIPSWDERLNYPSVTPNIETSQLNSSTYHGFTPMYRSPAYISTAAPYTATPSSRSILSPATKVLFEDAVGRRANGSVSANPEQAPRLQTFSPQHSPKKVGTYSATNSRPTSNESEEVMGKKLYFTSSDLGLRNTNLIHVSPRYAYDAGETSL